MSTATETRKAAQSQPAVFRHTKKTEWGLATLQWERDEKKCFRFEDGTERVFSLEFCHLLEPVDAPPERFARASDAAGRGQQVDWVLRVGQTRAW